MFRIHIHTLVVAALSQQAGLECTALLDPVLECKIDLALGMTPGIAFEKLRKATLMASTKNNDDGGDDDDDDDDDEDYGYGDYNDGGCGGRRW